MSSCVGVPGGGLGVRILVLQAQLRIVLGGFFFVRFGGATYGSWGRVERIDGCCTCWWVREGRVDELKALLAVAFADYKASANVHFLFKVGSAAV